MLEYCDPPLYTLDSATEVFDLHVELDRTKRGECWKICSLSGEAEAMRCAGACPIPEGYVEVDTKRPLPPEEEWGEPPRL
jgi:hypothetical protein